MLVSLKEIAKYVDISGLTPEEIASRLTFSGIEVEEIKTLSQATNLVVGKVISCLPHPNSDHLHVCKVDIGTEILDIVCGAPNCRKDLKVIVAKVGAKLPGGEIKAGKIRDEVSNGMLCALNELGVDAKFLKDEQIKGIEELDDSFEVGDTEVLAKLGLDDVILDLNLLANRSDCYSLYNVAREIGALFNRKVTIPSYEDEGTYVSEIIPGSETDKCDEFYLKEFNDIKIQESPKWLKEVLRSQGIRSIDNIVDIGNYVMLLTGQPIHMYDKDKLAGKDLTVKDTYSTKVVALDDKEYEIIPGDLIVASGDIPSCIGGVMGLKNVEVDENTKNIVVEVARFHHASIRHTSNRLGLVSDSSQRFVKEINPHQASSVLNLVSHLLKEVSVYSKESKISKYDIVDHTQKVIECSYSYINKRLGTDFDKETIKNTLNSLYFELSEKDEDNFTVKVPFSRIDVDGKADLSEEVVRYNGFSNVKSALPYMETTVGGLKVEEKKERAIEDLLLNRGFDEVLSYVLISEKDHSLFNYVNLDTEYKVLNPLTEDRKYVRKNLLTSLLRCAEYNLNHKNNDFKIFEISPIQTVNKIETHLVLGFFGNEYRQDHFAARPYDFFDAKGVLEAILAMFNIAESRIKIERIENSKELHPGRSAKIILDGKILAVLGELHPSIKNEFSMKNTTATVLEMNLSVLFASRSANNRFTQISRFPTVTRDYAFIVKEDIKFLDIKRELKKASSLIKDIVLFDIYKGEHVKEGYISLAVTVYFTSMDHTLKDEEIQAVDKKIREIISLKFVGEIRQ